MENGFGFLSVPELPVSKSQHMQLSSANVLYSSQTKKYSFVMARAYG